MLATMYSSSFLQRRNALKPSGRAVDMAARHDTVGNVIEGLISTIIPVFNRAAMLREAVGSALAQTWRPIEIIIVDDGSTDETPAAIRELASQHAEIRGTHIENGGPGVAREAGRQLARG